MDLYSDNDRTAAAWLRELCNDGMIPDGTVDERSIKDLTGDDLRDYRRVHLFAGIGGWAYALELAGWPTTRPVWTGSCPCQPFSAAGKRKGEADERHLWPDFFRLIRECRPATVFGEQVASNDGYRWLAGVRDDLETEGYAVGCADLPACSVGAPHIRQRLFWVANTNGPRLEKRCRERGDTEPQRAAAQRAGGESGGVGDAAAARRQGSIQEPHQAGERSKQSSPWGDCEWLPCADGKVRRVKSVFQWISDGLSSIMGHSWNCLLLRLEKEVIRYAKETNAGSGEVLRAMWESAAQETVRPNLGGYDTVQVAPILLVALCELAGRLGQVVNGAASGIGEIQEATMRILWRYPAAPATSRPSRQRGLAGSQAGKSPDALYPLPLGQSPQQETAETVQGLRGAVSQIGNVPETLSALEEVWRSFVDENPKEGRGERLQTGLGILLATQCYPLAPGLPGRVGLLRGAGNAIVPQVAAHFIRAFLEAESEL